MFAAKNELLTRPSGGYRISRSLRFRSSASAYLSRTPTAVNTLTWTFSAWIKRGSMGAIDQGILWASSGSNASEQAGLLFSSDCLRFFNITGGTTTINLITTQVFRDPSAWYHIVVVMDGSNATPSSRTRMFVNGIQITAFSTATYSASGSYINFTVGHTIGRDSKSVASLFDGYLAEVNFIDGQALTPSSFGAFDTNGVWQPKAYVPTGTGYGTNGFYLPFTDNSGTLGGNLCVYSEDISNAAYTKDRASVSANSTTAPNSTTTADTLIEDTTASNTHRYYSGIGSPTNGVTYTWSVYAKANTRSAIALEAWNGSTAKYAYADLSAGTIISGSDTSAAIVSVGSGWYRISVTHTGVGSSGSTGVYLMNAATAGAMVYTGNGSGSVYLWGNQVEQASSVGPYFSTSASSISSTQRIATDASVTTGGYNNWVTNNISLTSGTTYDSMIDSPTNYADGGNGRGNYCVLNPVSNIGNGTISNGNLSYTSGAAAWKSASGTIFAPSGKWYFEATLTSSSSSAMYGVINTSFPASAYGSYFGASAYGWGLQSSTGGTGKWNNNSSTSVDAVSQAANDVYMVAFDVDAGKVWFGKNGTWYGSGDPSTGANAAYTNLTGQIAPIVSTSTASDVVALNCGQRPFAYTPPSGFSALNTQNLPTPTIAAGNKHFDASLYQADGANAKTIVNSGGFQPDFVWIKDRTAAQVHALWDALRSINYLSPNTTNAEAAMGQLTSLNSNGFTVGYGAGQVNYLTDSYVGWQWNAGGSTVSGTGTGGITNVSYRANPTAGFSVVTYTGSGTAGTVTHGLGVAPSMVITKKRSSAGDEWVIWHVGLTSGTYVLLFTTAAQFTSTQYTAVPSPTVLNLNTATAVNNSGSTYVSYCFAPVAGYSSAFSYSGNGSSDGPMVYLSFRPRWLMIKRTDSTGNWLIWDTTRSPYNLTDLPLYPNLTNTEGAEPTRCLDVLSNGFKLKGTGTDVNASGSSYIGYAIAENPFKVSRAR